MRAFIISLVVVFFAGIAMGQDSKEAAESERRAQLLEEQRRRVEELNERLAELRNPAPRFVDRFVGTMGNSWAVSLVSKGGFFGFRTIASINSDKKAYCGFNNDSVIVANLPEELFFKIKAFVDRPPNVESKNTDQIPGCKDCSIESIVVSFRAGSDIRSQTYRVTESSPAVFRLYETMYDFKGCEDSTLH